MKTNRTSTTAPAAGTGALIEFSYPFIRETFIEQNEEGSAERPCWRPGCRQVDTRSGDSRNVADGIGQQILTIISRHKPGGFPERVFYTRRWRDPSGKLFGKNALHVRSAANFTALTKGYRHNFDLSGGSNA